MICNRTNLDKLVSSTNPGSLVTLELKDKYYQVSTITLSSFLGCLEKRIGELKRNVKKLSRDPSGEGRGRGRSTARGALYREDSNDLRDIKYLAEQVKDTLSALSEKKSARAAEVAATAATASSIAQRLTRSRALEESEFAATAASSKPSSTANKSTRGSRAIQAAGSSSSADTLSVAPKRKAASDAAFQIDQQLLEKYDLDEEVCDAMFESFEECDEDEEFFDSDDENETKQGKKKKKKKTVPLVRSSKGVMVNENMSLARSKEIEQTGGNKLFQKQAKTKASKGQGPQLLDVMAQSPFDFVNRWGDYVRNAPLSEVVSELNILDLDDRLDVGKDGRKKSCVIEGCTARGRGALNDNKCLRHYSLFENAKNGETKLVLCEKGDVGAFFVNGLRFSQTSRVCRGLMATKLLKLDGKGKGRNSTIAMVGSLLDKMKFDWNFVMVQDYDLRETEYSDNLEFIAVHPLYTDDNSIAKITHNLKTNPKWNDGEVDEWVECSSCGKLRKLPACISASLPDKWYCADNTWDTQYASCSADQEEGSEE